MRLSCRRLPLPGSSDVRSIKYGLFDKLKHIGHFRFANSPAFVAHLVLEVTSNEKSFIHFDGGCRSGKRICF